MRIIILLFLCVACASEPIGEKKTYVTVRLSSSIDGLYKIDMTIQDGKYCYKKSGEGPAVYVDNCTTESGERLFGNVEDAMNESRRLVENTCGGKAVQVGTKKNHDHIGFTKTYCNSTAQFGQINTSCNGGNPIYMDGASLFYRCETNHNSKRISDLDEQFLNKMLAEKKISKDQYDNLINGSNSHMTAGYKENPTLDINTMKEKSEKDDIEFQKMFDTK